MSERLVERLCKSNAHEKPRVCAHCREVLEDGRVRLTCTVCGKERTIPLFSDQQLIDLHEEGLNDREKAERLGVSHFMVKYRRQKLGIESIRSRRSRINHGCFLELYERGLYDPGIADALGVAPGVVSNHRKKHGLASNYKPPFTDQQLITLYKKGLHDAEIADELDVPKYVVRYHRRRLNLKAHGHKRLFSDQQLIALHERGFNDREKAERLNASEEVVFYHRNRLGLKPIGKHKHGVEAVREAEE